jgi:hypothetical protein
MEQLQSSVDRFLKRRQEAFAKDVYERHADPNEHLILPDGLQHALEEMGVQIKSEEVQALMVMTDFDKNGGLDFEEFRRALMKPPTKLEQWVDTLPLAGLLASCFTLPEGDQLHEVSLLSAENLNAIAEAYAYGLKRVLVDAQSRLKETLQCMETKAKENVGGESSKFKTFKMSTGSVPHYIEGLTGRIGM